MRRVGWRKGVWYGAAVLGGALVVTGAISYFFQSQVGDARYLLSAIGLSICGVLVFTRELRDR